MRKRPNVLMILADQHNAGLLGCAGHGQALTPNFDAFARSAMRFTNAYAANTICTPSRVSILSGQTCHNHGYYGLSGPISTAPSNLFRHFKEHGYRTAGYGKLHLPCSPRNWIADDVDEFQDAYERADGTLGGSDYFDYVERLGLRDVEDSFHNDRGTYGPKTIQLDAMPSKMPYEHTLEMWCARRAMQFMEDSGDQPFCIQIAFQKPHHPLTPQPRFWDLYPDDLELPDALGDLPTTRGPAFRAAWKAHHDAPWEYAADGEPIEEGFRRAWRGTLACISQVDDVFGKLMTFLEEKGLADDTIVIYSSDHGAYHGIHGLREKAPGINSNEVCRVPLLWRAPGVTEPMSVQTGLFSEIDFVPTLSALCGLPILDSADGLDVTPMLRGESSDINRDVVTENVWSKAIRWDRWRLVHTPRGMFGDEDACELYDLEADPGETANLAGDPAYREIVEEGRRRLLDWLIRTSRATTNHPAAYEKDLGGEKTELIPHHRTYPVASDGRAPRALQPRFRDDLPAAYL